VIDLRSLRENPERARASQIARGADPSLVDSLLTADAERRAAVAAADTMRAEQKTLGRSVGQAAKEDRPALLEHSKELAAQVRAAEAQAATANDALVAAHKAFPNLIEDGVPSGGEQDYVVLEHVGTPPTPRRK
jgi:seryl-tRNA synthetase